jgi:hypothetical protein
MNAAGTTLSIARGTCRTLRATQGGWVSVRAGRAWVTVQGDPEDYWLAPGEALPVAPGERVCIGGWDEAVLCEWGPLDAMESVKSAPLASQPWAALRTWLGRYASRVVLWPHRTRTGALRGMRAIR